MQRLTGMAAILGIAALSSCMDNAPLDEAAVAAIDDATPMLAVDGKPAPGRYRAISEEDGTLIYVELKPNGSYRLSTSAAVPLEEGRWEQNTQQLLCFTADRKTAEEVCYREKIGPDGVWRSTHPETDAVSRIERSIEE